MNNSNEKDPSTTSQVFEWLSTLPIGAVVFSYTARQALPHLQGVRVSAALSLLAQPQYAVLRKGEVIGGYLQYIITDQILKGWKGRMYYGKVSYSKEHPEGFIVHVASTTANTSKAEQAKSYAVDTLLESAMMAEQEAPYKDIWDTVRKACHAIKYGEIPGDDDT